MPGHPYQSDDRPFSRVLEDLAAKDDPRLYMGELIDAFGERGMGALLLFLGLVSALVGAIPGSTTVIGIPMLVIAVQLLIRRDQLWMPRMILKRPIDRAAFRSGIGRALKPLRMLERVSRPRLSVMTNEVSEILIGLFCTLLCAILILPLWGANLFPSLIVAAFGFGLMQKDGMVIAAAWVGVVGFGVFMVAAWGLIIHLAVSGWAWVVGLFQ